MKKPGVLLGALVAFLLTLPLLAVLYVGNQIAGFPFVPFSFFNNVRDFTPGFILIPSIEAMKDVVIALNIGRTDTVAKIAEESIAVIMVLVIMLIAGALFFAVMRRVERRQEWIPGAIFGLIVGVPMAILSLVGNQVFTADKLTSAIWLIGVFLIWGYANNWAYNRLTYDMNLAIPKDATPEQTASAITAQKIDRRQFLIQLGGATAAITVVGALVGSLAGNEGGGGTVSTGAVSETEVPQANLPNASAAVVPAPGTRPELTSVDDFYRIDISLAPPDIDGTTWTLPWVTTDADGAETKIAEMTLDDIRKLPKMEQYITQGCISNEVAGSLISTIKWTGASAQDVLKQVKLPADATHLLISSADGFYESVALDMINQDPSIMFGYEWEDQPLTTLHGFPLRIHIPNLYGMKQPKWITKIAVLNHDVDGYWVVRGWDKQAVVRSTSVIDTVATSALETENGQQLVPVGGIAWAGSRGISKVEVSVDNGDWVEAKLRDPLSRKAWVIWRYDWPFASGNHTFAVRCTDGAGVPQITDVNGPAPSGATGIHQVSVTV